MPAYLLHKDTILQLLHTHKHELKDYGVQEIGLFGSYARNEPTQESDIDLLVDFTGDRQSLRNFIDLSYYLEELLGKKVELTTRQSVTPDLEPQLLQTVEYVSLGEKTIV